MLVFIGLGPEVDPMKLISSFLYLLRNCLQKNSPMRLIESLVMIIKKKNLDRIIVLGFFFELENL